MLRFRQMRSLQKFASIHAHFHNHFALERHLVDREIYKQRRSVALAQAHLSRAECPRSKPEVHRVESGSPLSDSTIGWHGARSGEGQNAGQDRPH